MAFTSNATVTLPDGRTVRLGAKRPASKPARLQFNRYVNLAAVQVPDSVDYASKAMQSIRRMYANDQYGDCVIAGMFHHVGVWSGNDLGDDVEGTDQEVISQYQTICGPGDNGCYVGAVLDYAQSNGLVINGATRKHDGSVAVDNRNKKLCQVAAILFGGLGLAFQVPPEWINNAKDGAVWDVPSRIKSVGGHYVAIVDYNQTGVRVATWGLLITITWKALANVKIVSELYAILSRDWYNNDLISPANVHVDELLADLAKIKGGELPPLPDPTPPTPPVPPVPPVPPTPTGPWFFTQNSDRLVTIQRQ